MFFPPPPSRPNLDFLNDLDLSDGEATEQEEPRQTTQSETHF